MKKSPSIEKLVAAARNKRSGRRCGTCELPQKLREQAERGARLGREAGLTWPTIEREVARPLGYPFSAPALQRHMEKCVGQS